MACIVRDVWVRGTALCCCRNAVGSRQQGRPLLLVGTRFCCLSALPALAASLARSLDSVLKLYCRGPFVLAATRLASLCVSTRHRVRVRVRLPACSLGRAREHTYTYRITYLSRGRAEVSSFIVSSRSCLPSRFSPRDIHTPTFSRDFERPSVRRAPFF